MGVDSDGQALAPRHVGIIMDGNGRWAEREGHERTYGHAHGRLPVRESIAGAIEAGVEVLTLYAFSTENWKRPQGEVDMLMELLAESLAEYSEELQEQGVALRTVGDLSRLPGSLQEGILRAVRETEGGRNLTLVVALNYGGRDEIVMAARELARACQAGRLEASAIDEGMFARALYTRGLPDVELMIRTSGEQRLSNFLLWQCAYAEFLFLPIFWPDFRKGDFLGAVEEFKRRNRRFGGV
ncbi:MAG: di-trans,poly-cis-decaprenylcistransferase [Bacteroidetes bacterium]|nr:MAG: di-trans,poly-cis-decaprenylcistransferase [Bacteroidota bacterium]